MPRHQTDLEGARESLSRKEFEAAWSRGVALSVQQAVALACKRQMQGEAPATRWSSLTKTEREVAALVAEGMTNRQIAECMIIAPTTVRNHLSSAYSRLGIKSRTELAGVFWGANDRPR